MVKKWKVLAIVGVGTLLAAIDSSIVNLALPTLTREFHVPFSQIKWILIVYHFSISIFLLLMGRLSDCFGRRLLFGGGFLVFALGSFVCGFASHLGILMGARFLQAIGAAMFMATGPAIITHTFSVKERGRVMGTLSMMVGGGLILGPLLGGWLISTFGWRSVFFFPVPIALMVSFVIFFVFPKEKRGLKFSFDWPGALFQSVLMVLFVFALDPHLSFSKAPLGPTRWVSFLLLIVSVILFIYLEKFSKHPILEASLLKIHNFWSTNLAMLFIFPLLFAVMVLMPFYLEQVLHFSPKEVGFFMSAIPCGIFLISPVSGFLSDRIGSKELCALSVLVFTFCFFMLSKRVQIWKMQAPSSVELFSLFFLVGIGSGLFQSPNNNTMMSSVPVRKLNTAAALMATVRNISMILGTALIEGVFSFYRSQGVSFAKAAEQTYTAYIGLSMFTFLIVLLRKGGPASECL